MLWVMARVRAARVPTSGMRIKSTVLRLFPVGEVNPILRICLSVSSSTGVSSNLRMLLLFSKISDMFMLINLAMIQFIHYRIAVNEILKKVNERNECFDSNFFRNKIKKSNISLSNHPSLMHAHHEAIPLLHIEFPYSF